MILYRKVRLMTILIAIITVAVICFFLSTSMKENFRLESLRENTVVSQIPTMKLTLLHNNVDLKGIIQDLTSTTNSQVQDYLGKAPNSIRSMIESDSLNIQVVSSTKGKNSKVYICVYGKSTNKKEHDDDVLYIFNDIWHQLTLIRGPKGYIIKSLNWDPIDEIIYTVNADERYIQNIEVKPVIVNSYSVKGGNLLSTYDIDNANTEMISTVFCHNNLYIFYSSRSKNESHVAMLNSGKIRQIWANNASDLSSGDFENVEKAPNGNKIAFNRSAPMRGKSAGIWILDPLQEICERVTEEPEVPYYHVLLNWEDNHSLQFLARQKDGGWSLYRLSNIK